jgi:multiple sugar transport system ATP-binding protein
MNFFNGKIEKKDSKLVIKTEGFEVEIPKDKIKTYEYLEGKKIIFGIRPEDIHNPEFLPAGIKPAFIKSKVDVTELMGNEIFLHLKPRESDPVYVARVDPRTHVQVGEEIQIAFNMENIHIFDPSKDPENPVAVR